MNKIELISIIVPNYNNEKYIEECLESILEQSYKNIEILIIDDASTDKSIDIIRKYSKKYSFIKPIFNQKNMGVTINRDRAIKEANGKFITTLDSDDFYMDKEKLEREMNIIQLYNEQGKNNIIAYSGIVLVNKKGKSLFPTAKKNIKEGYILKNIFSRDCMIPRDFVFTKKQYLEAKGFDIKIPIYEDWDLKIRLSKNNEFYYSGVNGIGYRRHGDGLSAADNDHHVKWLRYIYKKNKPLLSRNEKIIISDKLDEFMKKSFNVDLKVKIKDKLKNIMGLRNAK